MGVCRQAMECPRGRTLLPDDAEESSLLYEPFVPQLDIYNGYSCSPLMERAAFPSYQGRSWGSWP